MLRDTIRITLLGMLLLIAMAAAVGGVFYKSMVADTQERELSRLASHLDVGMLHVRHEVEEAKRRLLFLAESPPIQGIIRAIENGGVDPESLSTDAQWKARLQVIFRTMASLNPDVLQVRLIGVADNGRELIRVDRKPDDIVIVPDSALQEKGSRPHFQEIIKLRQGQVHEGPIDLSIEHGEFERPWRSVIRLGTPVFSKEGTLFGMVILNLDAEYLLRSLRASIPMGTQLTVADSRGNVIYHHEPEKRFGHLFGRPLRLQDLYPELDGISAGTQAVAYSGLASGGTQNPLVIHAGEMILDRGDPQQTYYAALAIPHGLLTVRAAETLISIVFVAAVFCALATALLFLASWRFTRPISHLEASAHAILDGVHPSEVRWPETSNLAVHRVCNAFARIITSLSERETAVEASHERLTTILDGTDNAIILSDSAGTIEAANRAALTIFGYSEQDLVGRNVRILMPSPRAEEHDRYIQDFQRTGVRKIIGKRRELTGLRKDGSIFDIEMTVSQTFQDGAEKYVAIIADISDRRGMARMKSEFVATVSHELRTPLAAIKGSLGVIRTGDLGDLSELGQEFIESAYSNCERLISLINDILDMEKIATGKMHFELDTIDLSDVVETAVQDCRGMARPFDVGIELDLPGQPCVIFGDFSRLIQVVANLLSNAVKFSPRGSTVTVSIRRTDRAWQLAVADCGPGIPEDFRACIFERFTQAEGSNTRRANGSGLGLAITKAIVDAHQGTIRFDTSDRGTTFFVELTASDSVQAKRPRPLPGERGRFLICESDEAVSRLLKDTLLGAGFEAEFARDFASAMAILETNAFTAVLVDWNNPGDFAKGIVETIATLPQHVSTPIVAISPSDSAESRREIDSLVMRWLRKPFSQDALVRTFEVLSISHGQRPLKVLHVEDEIDHQKIVRSLLEGLAEVTQVKSVAQATELLAGTEFDVVILDQYLPDGLGLSLLDDIERLKDRPEVMIFSIDLPPPEVRHQVSASIVKSSVDNEKLLLEIKQLLRTARRTRN